VASAHSFAYLLRPHLRIGFSLAVRGGRVIGRVETDTGLARSDTARDGKQLLGLGEQPWVAGTAAGAFAVWISRRNGDLWPLLKLASRSN